MVIKKKVLIISLFLVSIFGNSQESFDQLFESGNAWYQKDSIAKAIDDYEKATKLYKSSALYYNLGNAYYQTGNLGKTILYFEKARKLDPTDESITHNLKLANLAIKDKIEEQVSPVKEMIASSPSNLFAWLSILFFILCLAGVFCLFILRNKKMGILFTTIGGICFFLFFILASVQHNISNSTYQGIILSSEVTVLSAPSTQTGNKVYELHEGAKVNILRKENDWIEISTNGNIGWVSIEDCGVI